MIEPQLLIDLYTETHRQIKGRIAGLTHEEGPIGPPGSGNGLNQILSQPKTSCWPAVQPQPLPDRLA